MTDLRKRTERLGTMQRILLGLSCAALAGALPFAATMPAAAQEYPGAYPGGPAYHQDDVFEGAVVGEVTGLYHSYLTVDTAYGARQFELHEGTIIYPTGTVLQNGMTIRVEGHRASSGVLLADDIHVVPPRVIEYRSRVIQYRYERP